MGFERARLGLGRAWAWVFEACPGPIKPMKVRPSPPTKAQPVRPAYIYNYV
ncbi:hypothetical protein ACE6H2_016884 [Prunus campanulata]